MCAIKVAANVNGQFAQTREEVRTEHIFPLADRILAWLEQPEKGERTNPNGQTLSVVGCLEHPTTLFTPPGWSQNERGERQHPESLRRSPPGRPPTTSLPPTP